MVVIARQKLAPLTQQVSGFLRTARIPPWSSKIRPALLQLSARLPQASIYVLMAGISGLVSFYPSMLPMQPRAIDMQPIVNFLAQGDRSQYRYLTFGFGDQFGYLNRLTTATTIDGSYHTARTLPELRSSGIGSIDASYWLPGGLEKLASILQIAGKYGVRWGFVADTKYDADLLQNGWDLLNVLSNGVQVWTNTRPFSRPRPLPRPITPWSLFHGGRSRCWPWQSRPGWPACAGGPNLPGACSCNCIPWRWGCCRSG